MILRISPSPLFPISSMLHRSPGSPLSPPFPQVGIRNPPGTDSTGPSREGRGGRGGERKRVGRSRKLSGPFSAGLGDRWSKGE